MSIEKQTAKNSKVCRTLMWKRVFFLDKWDFICYNYCYEICMNVQLAGGAIDDA